MTDRICTSDSKIAVRSLTLAVLISLLCGCSTSSIVPMRGTHSVEEWVPAEAEEAGPATMAAATETAATMAATDPAFEPAALASSRPAASTEPSATMTSATTSASATTQPLVKRTRQVDQDQTARYVYRANYKHAWEEAQVLITNMGYRLDRQDYRLGVMTTMARPSAEVVEPWRLDQVGVKSSLENSVNRQQRSIRLSIKAVEGKAAFFEISVQVLVERQSNPGENLGGEAFITGSGFGRVPVSLRSDYTPGPQEEPGPAQMPQWRVVGHDVKLEKKILDQLFEKI